MTITFLVNDAADLEPGQTTTMLIRRAVEAGHAVQVVGVADLAASPEGAVRADVRRVDDPAASHEVLVEDIAAAQREPAVLDEADVLFIRTNPARDAGRAWAHDGALALAYLLETRGVHVVNRPEGLRRAASKLYLHHLPESVRPKTLVSADRAALLHFVRGLDGPAVLKPLQGTRGTDVFFVRSPKDKNVRPILDALLRGGFVMAQAFVPEATEGDTRLVVMDGALLEVDGRAAAIRRVPAGDDFRSNIHAGGHAELGVVTEAMRDVVAQVGPQLTHDGIWLAGLDFIGGRIVEVNVFSTGGLRDAERFTGADFTGAVLAALEQRVAR